MFLVNRYTTCYFEIIKRAQTSIYDGPTEKHHIVPESLGGSNEKSNIVKLTPREHFICHRLLVKMLVGKSKSKMALAVLRLSNPSKLHAGEKITGIKYEHIRKSVSETRRGIPMHPNTKASLDANRNKNGGPNKGKKLHENTKKARLIAVTGKELSIEHKQKLSSKLIGRKFSDETIQRMRIAATKRHADKKLLKSP